MVPTYGGIVNKNEPSSFVCKISGNSNWNMPIAFRMFQYVEDGCNGEEIFNRQEGLFFQKIPPLMQNTEFGMPKSYFIGIDDNGNSSFTQYVIQNKPPRVRSVLVIEDLSHWKSLTACTCLTKEEVIACLKNISILHAKSWGNKEIFDSLGPSKADTDARMAHYSKFAAFRRKRQLSSVNSVQNKIKKFLSTEWIEHSSMRLPKGTPTPDWLTIEPTDDGSYIPLRDPLLNEMLSDFANKLPDYYQNKLKHFYKRENQSIIHGDFHSGNHMYGKGDNEGKVIVVDFQMIGSGMVVNDVLALLMYSWRVQTLDEIDDFIKEYHNALVENGVNDYSWIEFKNDFELAIVESMLSLMDFFGLLKPTTMYNMLDKGNKQKADGLKKIFDLGVLSSTFLILTSMYARDKENFLKT